MVHSQQRAEGWTRFMAISSHTSPRVRPWILDFLPQVMTKSKFFKLYMLGLVLESSSDQYLRKKHLLFSLFLREDENFTRKRIPLLFTSHHSSVSLCACVCVHASVGACVCPCVNVIQHGYFVVKLLGVSSVLPP